MKKPEYKLAHLDKIQIASAARKALMIADAHYFSWTPQQQEHFRATMTEAARRKIQRVLLEDLLGIKCTVGEVHKVWNDIPIPKLTQLNWATLLTGGIGEDNIYLNESMAEGKTLLNYKTLYDYNYSDYLYQEKANKRDFADYKGSAYYAYKHPSWVRLLIEDQLYYCHFLSLATHFMNEIESAGNDYIEQLIPHKYVEGKDQGKKEKAGILWDMKIDADGQEAQLEELKSRWYPYQQERWLALSKSNKETPAAVFTQEINWDDDPNRLFIFNNEASLKLIRWRHFLSDCAPLMTDFSTVEGQLQREIGHAKSWLAQNHQDIINNFDPNVVKLRKKRKIIMAPQALEDLSKIEPETDRNK